MSKFPLALIASGLLGGLLLLNGGKGVSPGPNPSDAVATVFRTQETAFRKFAGELAPLLRSGQVNSEAEATTWFDARFGPASEAAWTPLLEAEKAAFGGEQWTAEKQAAHIERYAR